MKTYFKIICNKYIIGILSHLIYFQFSTSIFYSQTNGNLKSIEKQEVVVKNSADGVEYMEIQAFKSSFLGDNKLSILKIDPQKFDFMLICASQNGSIKNAIEWMDTLKLSIIFNAGMYNLKDKVTHKYYLKNFKHINNSVLSSNANGIIAFNPSVDTIPKIQLFDLTMDSWEEIERTYMCIIQGQRMIDCNGSPVFWNNRGQFCSMLVLAQDKANKIYLIFSRSPFTQNQMIENLINLPFEIINAIYLEGGSRANFVLKTKEVNVKKVGSFVSVFSPNDKNQTFFPFPNFIGLTKIKF